MERPCYQCGLTVEDVVIFCPQCRAPQIRAVSTMPAPQPVKLGILRRPAVPLSTAIDWSRALPAVILAVLVAALLSVTFVSLGFGLFICGMLSVFFYRQRNKMAQISRWMGARLGVFSGVLGLLLFIVALVGKLGFHQVVSQTLEKILERTPDPVARQNLQDLATQHLPAFIAVLIISAIIVFFLFTGLGGIIGAALVNRWRPSTPATSSDHETKLDHHENTERSDHD